MQKLFIESVLPVPPERAWEVFESDAFRGRLSADTGLTGELLREHREGDVNVRVLRFTSGRDLPLFAAKALGGKRLSYEQENRFHVNHSRLDWIVRLPVLGNRVRVEGSTLIEPRGEGSFRTVTGEIEVKMRLIGSQVEKVVVSEFDKSMRRAVELAVAMMNE